MLLSVAVLEEGSSVDIKLCFANSCETQSMIRPLYKLTSSIYAYSVVADGHMASIKRRWMAQGVDHASIYTVLVLGICENKPYTFKVFIFL